MDLLVSKVLGTPERLYHILIGVPGGGGGAGLSHYQGMQRAWQENKPPLASRHTVTSLTDPFLVFLPPPMEVMSTAALPSLEDRTGCMEG